MVNFTLYPFCCVVTSIHFIWVSNLRFYQGLGVCEATVERQVAVAQPPVQDGLANRIADQDGRPPPLEQPAHHGQGQLLRACVTLGVWRILVRILLPPIPSTYVCSGGHWAKPSRVFR